MSLWVKICGNTSFEDAMLAAEAGADAVGFVLASSPRQVTADQVAIIASKLPPSIEKIGVFVDASFDEIEATVSSCGLTGVQLHFEAGQDLARKLRERFGSAIRIFGVVHVPVQSIGSDRDDGQMKDLSSALLDAHVDAVLVDSYSLTARGGTGQIFDWGLAAATLFRDTLKPKVAAGGLTPDNVAEAIRILRPWGIDVVSGVEAFPGRKDPAKVRAFLNNVRMSTLPLVRTLK